MPTTFTPNLNLSLQATGEDVGTWGGNLNTGVISILDAALGGTLALPLSNADVTLNTAQSQNNFISLTGTITANINVIFPNIGRTYIVRNSTTGAFTVTLKTVAGGATVTIAQGAIIVIALTGGDIVTDNIGFTPVQQGGGIGQLTNKIRIGWNGSALALQVDATNYASTWPINVTGSAGNVGGVSNPTARNSVVVYQSGTLEFGPITVGAENLADLPNPYVMTGLRASNPGISLLYLRARIIQTP